MVSWTTEQVLALSPDAGSTKSGRELATPRKWVSLAFDEQTVWGQCQGSGKVPYQTQIDLSEPAFKCSCPSRKFPCKHGLGLFLLLVSNQNEFKQESQPAWVTEWLTARAKRSQERPAKTAETTPDPAAQTRRATDRQKKITAGIADLERWLFDLARNGLANVQTQPKTFWNTPAARLVDAQAPGIARLVRMLPEIASSGDGWQSRLLERIADIHLLKEGFKRIDTLSPETQSDIKTAIGYTQNQEEILAQNGVHDRWAVIGQVIEDEERVRAQRTWLLGNETGRPAVVLSFAVGNQTLDTGLIPGTVLDAGLVFFPGAFPLRALVKERFGVTGFDSPSCADSITHAVEAYAIALSRNPWIEHFPIALKDVVVARNGNQSRLRDSQDNVLAVPSHFDKGWELMSLSGGPADQSVWRMERFFATAAERLGGRSVR